MHVKLNIRDSKVSIMKFSQLLFTTLPLLASAARLGTPSEDKQKARALKSKGKDYEHPPVPPPLPPCGGVDMSVLGGSAGTIDAEAFGAILQAGEGIGLQLESACLEANALCLEFASLDVNAMEDSTMFQENLDLFLLFACCSELPQFIEPETNGQVNLGIALLIQGALAIGSAAGGLVNVDDITINIDPENQCAVSASVGGANGGDINAVSFLVGDNIAIGYGESTGNIDTVEGFNVGAGATLNVAAAVGNANGGNVNVSGVTIGTESF